MKDVISLTRLQVKEKIFQPLKVAVELFCLDLLAFFAECADKVEKSKIKITGYAMNAEINGAFN